MRSAARLTTLMLRVVQSDTVGERGERTLVKGDATLLEGFEFNTGAAGSTLKMPYSLNVSATAGTAAISIPSFVPRNGIEATLGATHYRIVLGAAHLDFATGRQEAATDDSGWLAYDSAATAAMTLQCMLASSPASPLVVVLGVQYSQKVNGTYWTMQNSAYNALGVVKVDV